jgi:hypothetical protein
LVLESATDAPGIRVMERIPDSRPRKRDSISEHWD